MDGGRGQADRRGGSASTGRAWLAVGLAALGGASCFDGASAQGLPCEVDRDCGVGDRCVLGFCGGPPATSSGPSSGTSAASSSTGTSGTSAEESTGSGATCGDGTVDPGEDCDAAGVDTQECDMDCTAVRCGDEYVNAMAGEHCDDGNASPNDGCTPQCLPTLFWDDMEDGPTTATKWSTEIPTFMGLGGKPFSLPGGGWVRGLPGMIGSDAGVWHSGEYPEAAGTARLVTEPITFPAEPIDGARFELRFRHTVRFDANGVLDPGCPQPQFADGGTVGIVEMGQSEMRVVGPPMGEGSPLAGPVDCEDIPENPNPLATLAMPPRVYGGTTGATFQDVALVLDDVAGKTVRLVFEMSYDCRNCWTAIPMGAGDPPPAGWIIDDVLVAAFAEP